MCVHCWCTLHTVSSTGTPRLSAAMQCSLWPLKRNHFELQLGSKLASATHINSNYINDDDDNNDDKNKCNKRNAEHCVICNILHVAACVHRFSSPTHAQCYNIVQYISATFVHRNQYIGWRRWRQRRRRRQRRRWRQRARMRQEEKKEPSRFITILCIDCCVVAAGSSIQYYRKCAVYVHTGDKFEKRRNAWHGP